MFKEGVSSVRIMSLRLCLEIYKPMKSAIKHNGLSEYVATSNITDSVDSPRSLAGLWIAVGIMSLWLGTLGLALFIPINHLSPLLILVIIFLRMFLHTGLFITAHDSMHGSIIPKNHRLNGLIGQVAVGLYACLPYRHCALNHQKHHHAPGQVADPDFHDGINTEPIYWYFKFISEYVSFRQLIIFIVVNLGAGLILHFGLQVAWLNLLLFWGLPFVFSSIQLFYFGTYLPHREQPKSYLNASSQVSQNRINYGLNNLYFPLGSFLSCYHFGAFHSQHHQFPEIPWYRLPNI